MAFHLIRLRLLGWKEIPNMPTTAYMSFSPLGAILSRKGRAVEGTHPVPLP